jgi:hypothetical protein
MNREQLEHVIRAAAANADTDQIVIVGSQSILGAYPEVSHPVLCRSMEADVFPLESPQNSILIDGAIGERSIFHETFGYYAHGVAPDTAVLPEGCKAAWFRFAMITRDTSPDGVSSPMTLPSANSWLADRKI